MGEVPNCNSFDSCMFHQFKRIKQQCTFFFLAIFNPTFPIFYFSGELLVIGVQLALSDWFNTL